MSFLANILSLLFSGFNLLFTIFSAPLANISIWLLGRPRGWGIRIPDVPADPDRLEALTALRQISTLLEERNAESKVIVGLLRELKEKSAEDHIESRRVQSALGEALRESVRAGVVGVQSSSSHYSTDPRDIDRGVHLTVASQVDRLVRNPPQSVREAKSENFMSRHKRWHSA